VFQSSKGCSGCHPQQYAQWKRSLHALSHREPVYDFAFMTASRQSGKRLETYCGRCHTPVGVLDGEIPFAHRLVKRGDTQVSAVADEGVPCDLCHTITGHTALQNAGFLASASDVKLGPLRDPKPVSHRAKYRRLYRSAEYCGTCHQVVHPENGIELETTYSEWKASPYAKAGIVCQDCHMTRGLQPDTAAPLGRSRKHPGKAAVMGRRRAHVSLHDFVGANLMYLQGNDPAVKRLRARTEALLRRAGRVSIQGLWPARRGLELRVKVSNTGAGHYLPTGVTEIRELWLEVKVTSATGRVIFVSGDRDPAGDLKPGTVVYRTTVLDEKGRDTTLFWNTVKKARDYRIPPRGHRLERFTLPPAARTEGRLMVEVALQYRSIAPRGLREANVPPGTVTVPIFTIHRHKRVLRP
jgi:hypothetical protein